MRYTKDDQLTVTNAAKFCEDIGCLYLNEKFSDVILILEKQKLHAHKVILAARCEYFETLLYDGSESSQNEVAIANTSPEAFKMLLKYIYTGTLEKVYSKTDIILDLLGLARQYSFAELQLSIYEKLKTMLDSKNIYSVLNRANLYQLEELRETCLQFSDDHASEVLTNDGLTGFTQESMIQVLKRDTLIVPEIEIFKAASKWCKKNEDVDSLVMGCVRFGWLTGVEIVSEVWPSKLVQCETLLNAVAEIVDVKPKPYKPRPQFLMDENVAAVDQKSEIISGINTTFLLKGNIDVAKYASHAIGDNTGITVKLGNVFVINHIRMKLWDENNRYYYSYYIETFIDNKKWTKVINYTQYACRSNQNLYFNEAIAKYIRIMGTHNSQSDEFCLIFFEAYYKTTTPTIVNGVIVPTVNVATLDKNAIVVEGNSSDNALLNGKINETDNDFHIIGQGSIIIQLAQPYVLSSMKLHLWDRDYRIFKYYIETSCNKSDWEMAVDRRNQECTSWQEATFNARPTVFIRITGTYSSTNEYFTVTHFECPASVAT